MQNYKRRNSSRYLRASHLEVGDFLRRSVKEKEIADFINGLGNSVINGEDSFKEGCRTDLLLDNYQLWFIEVDNPYFEDDGVPTELRIIYPDEYNRMPWDNDCDEMYKGQIADIPPEKIREVLSKCN